VLDKRDGVGRERQERAAIRAAHEHTYELAARGNALELSRL
jgi:hypothetical protein